MDANHDRFKHTLGVANTECEQTGQYTAENRANDSNF